MPIKKAQEAKGDDDHVHDASKFSFIKTSKLENVHSGAYFYGQKLNFLRRSAKDNELTACIYKTNSSVYQTAEYVDMMCSGLIIYSGYKVVRNSYIMAMTAGIMSSYAPFTLLWGALGFIQYQYLAGAYIQQVYLVDEIELMENMSQIRIRTIFFNMKANLFA